MAAIPTQDHIHLSMDLGSSPEFAPDKSWTIIDRRLVPVVFLSPSRGLKGKFYPNSLKDGADTVKIRNFKYTVKLIDVGATSVDDFVEDLLEMQGERVKLVDIKHANDGSDHTTYVKDMVLTDVGELKADHTALAFYYIDITLEDDSL